MPCAYCGQEVYQSYSAMSAHVDICPANVRVAILTEALADAEVGCVGFAGFHDGADPAAFHLAQAEQVAIAYRRRFVERRFAGAVTVTVNAPPDPTDPG